MKSVLNKLEQLNHFHSKRRLSRFVTVLKRISYSICSYIRNNCKGCIDDQAKYTFQIYFSFPMSELLPVSTDDIINALCHIRHIFVCAGDVNHVIRQYLCIVRDAGVCSNIFRTT